LSEIGIGLIGLGVHGKRYATHLLRGDVANARLAAVCRRDSAAGESFARENGLRHYDAYEELARAKEVDAVAVVTPSPAHLPMCKAALEAGKPVLVEKPVLHSTAEGRDLAGVLSARGGALMVAQTLRFNGVIRCLRERKSLVGEPFRLRMAFRLPASRLYWESDKSGPPRGTILETGVHLFDAARWIVGASPSRVFCTSARIANDRTEDFFSAELEFEGSRARCVAEVAKCSDVRAEPVDLAGTDGHLIGNARTNELALVAKSGTERVDLGPPEHTVGAVLSRFVSHILKGERMSITLEDGLKAVQIAEACVESAKTGGYVEIPTGLWDESGKVR
jgi:predicted dehydrogenase